MEMHQFRYVAAVARTGNFSRAAEECHVAQPSLSQQIRKIEEELGERLFDRLRRHARLTPYGEIFLQRAAKILEEADAMQREAGDAKALLSGTVRVGALPTIAPYLLPEAVMKFSRKFPKVQLLLQEDTTAQLLRLALNCEIDFAIASHPIQDARFTIRELFSEKLLLALPPGHPLARKRATPIRIADLREEQLIVMKEGHCLGDQVMGFCDHRNLQIGVSFRGAQLETIQSLVRAGLGITLIPAMAVRRNKDDRLEYRSLCAPEPERKIIALWPKQRPPGRAAEEFLRQIPRPRP